MLKIHTSVSGEFQTGIKENGKEFLDKQYTKNTSIYDSFFQIASLGDVSSIYRNRSCFSNHKKQALVLPAKEVFYQLPCSRPSVYHYTGLLIHETVHYWFNKKENVQQLGAITSVREAAIRLLDLFTKFFTESDGIGGFEDLFLWLCEFCAELSSKNGGRPAMAHSQKAVEILATLKTNEVVLKMLALMDLVVTQFLAKCPEMCMKILFEASRHGSHFSWMWLHIASLLQSGLITQLLESGANQFDLYVAEIDLRKSGQFGTPAVLNIVQTEYENKFCAISDVFVYLMQKGNPELQDMVSILILESFDEREKGTTKIGFPFFFKLVTCSFQTLRIMMGCNCQLITPFNAIRAVRQIQAIDKSIVLPNANFADFITEIVEKVDPTTHGKIFETIVEIVYNPKVFEGEKLTDMLEKNNQLRRDCFRILSVMMNRIVRIAHATGPYKCPSQHPAVSVYASGEKLQFIVRSAVSHIDRPSSIQHLHAISIAFGEAKAAEIALRFIMTTSYIESNFLVSFMAFLNTTISFFPSMISFMYHEFSSLKTTIELSLPECLDRTDLHFNLLQNLLTLFNWEISIEDNRNHVSASGPEKDERCDKFAFACFKLYPGEYMAEVFNTVLIDSSKHAQYLINTGKKWELLKLHRMLTKLIEAICLSNSPTASTRKFLIPLSSWYKTISQLALLLRSTLLSIENDNIEGIFIFEELRTAIAVFLYSNHIDEQLSCFMPVFMDLFVKGCLNDSTHSFGESFESSGHSLIEEYGLNKLYDMNQLEDGPSVLSGLVDIKMKNSALDMLHTGKLKKRIRYGDEKVISLFKSENEDSKQRVIAVLDAVHAICFSGSSQIQLMNSKQLALTLLDSVCSQNMVGDMKFDDWEMESEFIHRHVEVDQKLSKNVLGEGILRILCETRSFGYCLPIMKAKLAVIINETGRFPERQSLTSTLRQKLYNWILLAHKGGIIPTRFAYICDLENYATVHETHLMLLEVWKFLMARNITMCSIDTYHEDLLRGDVDEGLPNEKDAVDRINFSVFRIVIQNHLPDSFHLFPSVFPSDYDFLKLSKLD